MGSELPVLEYAPIERVGGGDRYRLWFLLAGVPALVGACVPIVLSHSLVWVMVSALREATKLGFSSRSMPQLAIFTACLAPLSAMAWRVLRLRGSEPGRSLGIIGLAFAGIHVVGIWGLLGGMFGDGWEAGTVAAAAVVGLAMAVCGGFMWWSRDRLDLVSWVLLGLVGVEMAFWAIIGMVLLPGQGFKALGLVFVTTAVVRGVEWAHVLRSRRLVEQRV